MSSAAESSYDAVPYQSNPFPLSQPDRLAAVARLFGLQPALRCQANVLELGCASGGNLIPLAARYPDATFLGIDFSTVQVSAARRQIAALGLTNIRIEQGDITNFLAAEKFDYIICHGVYSWVPEATRAAISRLCRDGLTDHGVAYISYNAYPGWRLRQVVREAMLFDAGGARRQPVSRGADGNNGWRAQRGGNRATVDAALRRRGNRAATRRRRAERRGQSRRVNAWFG